MNKKYVRNLLLLVFLLSALHSQEALAADSVPVKLPGFSVTLNGQTFSNTYSKYPLLVYKDITYFPMTYYESRLLGLHTDWSEAEGFAVEKSNKNLDEYIREIQPTKNNIKQYAQIAAGKISVNGKEIVNSEEPYPLLSFRDILYFPLTWRFAVEEFGWTYSFDAEDGLVISNPEVSFKTAAEFAGPVNSGINYMGTGTLDFPCFFNADTVDVNGLCENPQIVLYMYNQSGRPAELLPLDFSWEYQIYYVIGEQRELVYRKAIPFYYGALANNEFALMRFDDEYWHKADFLRGNYEFVLVHPEEYQYRFIDGNRQVLTAPTEQLEAYAITFSQMVTVE